MHGMGCSTILGLPCSPRSYRWQILRLRLTGRTFVRSRTYGELHLPQNYQFELLPGTTLYTFFGILQLIHTHFLYMFVDMRGYARLGTPTILSWPPAGHMQADVGGVGLPPSGYPRLLHRSRVHPVTSALFHHLICCPQKLICWAGLLGPGTPLHRIP
eukprot:jgi/Botrbrau1/7479/Bobra.0095s0017.1